MMQRDATPHPIDRDLNPLEFVAGIASRVSSERTITNACLVVLEEGMALTGANCGEVLFRDTRTGQLTCLANRGPHPWCISETGGQSISTRLLETTFQDHLPLYVPEVRELTGVNLDPASDVDLSQALSVPLVVRGRALGALNLCGTSSASFPAETVAALSILAGLLAVTIENMFILRRSSSEEAERRQFMIKEIEASEDERQRIARELHDGIGQTLTALLMNIDATSAMLAHPRRRDGAQAQLEKTRDVASTLLQEVRRVILALRPTTLDDLGLCAAIDAHAKRVLGEAAIKVTVRCRLESKLPGVVENALFRVMQESVNNVAKHSQAKQCRVSLFANDGVVTGVVEDDGSGFGSTPGPGAYDHFGISGMRERIRVLGGTLEIRSEPGSGTRVTAEVPYEAEVEA